MPYSGINSTQRKEVAMDITSIGQLIGSYGFPIVACGALFWYIVKEEREMRTIVQQNTTVIAQLLEHLKREDGF